MVHSHFIMDSQEKQPEASVSFSEFSTREKISAMKDGKASLSEILGVFMCGLCGCAAMPAHTHLGSLQWALQLAHFIKFFPPR